MPRSRPDPAAPSNAVNRYVARIAGTGFVLWSVLVAIRAIILRIDFTSVGSWPNALLGAVSAGYRDFVLVVVMTAVAALLMVISRASSIFVRLVYYTFLFLVIVVCSFAVFNMSMIDEIGKPLTYEWLYYADFLQSVDTRFYVRSVITPEKITILISAILAAIILGNIFGASIYAVFSRVRAPKTLTASLVLILGAYLAYAPSHISRQSWPAEKVSNPLVAFAQSLLVNETPLLFTMAVESGPDDVKIVAERPREQDTTSFDAKHAVRNVVLFVIESVAAEYVQTYGGSFPVTPNIASLRSSSIQFQNIYAPTPATNFALVSLLTSIYPEISHKSMTAEYPDIQLDFLSRELKRHGYRTAFFSSADVRFQGLERFLAGRGFDRIEDYRGRDCDGAIFYNSDENWKYTDLSSDHCTASSVMEWIRASPEQPFFATMFTGLTHYPYFTTQGVEKYTGDADFDRYLNGLRETDAALGEIVQFLQDNGLAESTLVVVVGDHGEAFGQHPGNVVHAGAVYEENVHVPLLVSNRALFDGDTSSAVGSLIDIAPTILDVLGFPYPETWQGRSLFSANKPDRTYFFSPWWGFKFGFREGNMKFIIDTSLGTTELFDLSTDPKETVNLAASRPEYVKASIDRLAAWVQYQNRLMKYLTSRQRRDEVSQSYEPQLRPH